MVEIEIIYPRIYDICLKEYKNKGDKYKVTKERAENLIKKKYARIVKSKKNIEE